ncbi:MAG: glycosyltransferase family 4 protein [Candidatus Neomarinimicrobiota bacterium]
MTERFAVLLGDAFSLDEQGYFGRAFANRSLLKALFLSEQVEYVLTTTPAKFFLPLELPEPVRRKLVTLQSLPELVAAVGRYCNGAIFCSDFVAGYPDWVDFRNRQRLDWPVFGWTHSLSYQRYTAALYRILTAGATARDGIICTSPSAVAVVSKLLGMVVATLKAVPAGPSLFLLPLAYEAPEATPTIGKPEQPFQVLSLGRLDWQTKADLLVLAAIIRELPASSGIRFVVAGAGDNQSYVKLLQQLLVPLGVEVLVAVDEKQKAQLYRDSHVLFLPSDNYQETFGLALLESKHYGCVPVVADFDGFRSLVTNDVDGILLPTVAAAIPEELFRVQTIVSEAVYHGWWAAGVSIDPRQAAMQIRRLADDRSLWRQMSAAARVSVTDYTPLKIGQRLGELLAEQVPAVPFAPAPSTESYPGHWNFLDLFAGHPTAVWDDQVVGLTPAGEQFLNTPWLLPQQALLMKSVDSTAVNEFLRLVRTGVAVGECLRAGINPIVPSLALKNGLIYLNEGSL